MRKNHGKEEARARDLFYGLWINDLFMEVRAQQQGGPGGQLPEACVGPQGYAGPGGGRGRGPCPPAALAPCCLARPQHSARAAPPAARLAVHGLAQLYRSRQVKGNGRSTGRAGPTQPPPPRPPPPPPQRVESNGDWSLFCPNEAPGMSDVWGAEFEELYTRCAPVLPAPMLFTRTSPRRRQRSPAAQLLGTRTRTPGCPSP
jgi:hypothetical protein